MAKLRCLTVNLFLNPLKTVLMTRLYLLIRKLTELKISPLIVRVLESMLKNSTARVKFKDYCSTNWCITRGIRQGGVTSEHLFCKYIDHRVTRMAENKHSCRMGVISEYTGLRI